MRRATFAIVGIFLAAIICGGGPAAAHAEDVPLASSLHLESVMLVGGWASAGPFIPVIGDGTAHLAYEFYLTNFGKKAVRLVALRVRGIGGAAFAAQSRAMRSSPRSRRRRRKTGLKHTIRSWRRAPAESFTFS